MKQESPAPPILPSLSPRPLTSDVVEVVEAVEVQAAGLFVTGFWTLAPCAGRPQDVRRPYAAIGPGAWLQKKTVLKKTCRKVQEDTPGAH